MLSEHQNNSQSAAVQNYMMENGSTDDETCEWESEFDTLFSSLF